MIVDGLANGAPRSADVLIVGAGPAGMTLAMALDGSGLDVVVLEAGTADPADAVPDTLEAESTGLEYYPAATRSSGLGGTSDVWTGQVRPLDDVDFIERKGVHDVGWPISRGALTSYYGRACRIVEVSDEPFDLATWRDRLVAVDAPIVETELLTTVLFRKSPPTRFGERYRATMENSANVTVVMGATATRLSPNNDGSAIEQIDVALGTDRSTTISADRIVLAAGGLETTRLLLASDAASDAGIGAGRSFIGRGFMEHPHLAAATIATGPGLPGAAFTLFSGIGVDIDEQPTVSFISLRPEVITEEQLPNLGVKATLPTDDPERPRNDAVRALTHDVEGGEVGELLDLSLQAETRWFGDSSITLSDRTDALGMPRLRLNWQLDDRDIPDYARSLELIGREFGAAGLGRLRPHFRTDGPPPTFIGGHHHMGSTRMSESPSGGVVDAELRVHGVANLFIASSSVFPTAGFANPTLTIIALALRLADLLGGDGASARAVASTEQP